MSMPCHPLHQTLCNEMLQIVARSICDRPADNPAQRNSRTRQMIFSTMGLEPRDGLEFMLTTMIVGHFHLLLDSMSDVFQGQMDQMKARTKSTIVALDRSMLSFVKEMAVARRRPAVRWSEDAARAPEAVAEAAGVPADNAIPRTPPGEKTQDTPEPAVTKPPAAAMPARTVPVGVAPPRVKPARVAQEAAQIAGTPAGDGMRAEARRLAEAARSADRSGEPAGDDETLRRHVAEFHEAFLAMAETLTEARALDDEAAAAKAAGGD